MGLRDDYDNNMTDDEQAYADAEMRDWARQSPSLYIKGLVRKMDKAKTDDEYAYAERDLMDVLEGKHGD